MHDILYTDIMRTTITFMCVVRGLRMIHAEKQWATVKCVEQFHDFLGPMLLFLAQIDICTAHNFRRSSHAERLRKIAGQ